MLGQVTSAPCVIRATAAAAALDRMTSLHVARAASRFRCSSLPPAGRDAMPIDMLSGQLQPGRRGSRPARAAR